MEDLEKKEAVQQPIIEKININDIKKTKDDELVDEIIEQILKI